MNFKKVKEKYSFIVEGKDIIGIFIIVSIIVGISFGLGILTGREVFKEREKTEEKESEKILTETKSSPFPEGVSPSYAVPETGTFPQELTSLTPPEEQKEAKLHERPPQEERKIPEKIAPPGIGKKEDLKKKTKERKISSIKSRDFTIQVASFKTREEAIRLVRLLKSKGFDAYITTTSFGEKGVWHRVRIGYFESQEKAGKTLKKLTALGYKPFITRVDK